MSGDIRLDVRPFVAAEVVGEIVRGVNGRPDLRPAPGSKSEVRWVSALARLLGKAERVRVDVRLEREKPTRSLAANAYAWAVVYPTLYEGLRQIALDAGEECPVRSIEHLHEICKATFLPPAEVGTLGLQDRPTTTTLNTAQFAAYVNAIVQYAAERGIWIAPATHEGSAA